jgi:hypothetical protein
MHEETQITLAILDNAFKDLILKHDPDYTGLGKYPHRSKSLGWFLYSGPKWKNYTYTLQDICEVWDFDIESVREYAKCVYLTGEYHSIFDNGCQNSNIISDETEEHTEFLGVTNRVNTLSCLYNTGNKVLGTTKIVYDVFEYRRESK